MSVSSIVVGQSVDQELGDRLRVLDETPRSPRASCPEVEAELDRDGLVEPVAADEVVADGVRGPFAEHGPAGITGDDSGQREDDEDEPEQDRDRDEEPSSDEPGQGIRSVPSDASR